MSAPQTRQRPAGTGREVEQQIDFARQLYGDAERNARAGYHGHRPPHLTLVPRDEGTIVRELVDAAERLRGLACGAQIAGTDLNVVDECSRITLGCSRLIAELRQAVAR